MRDITLHINNNTTATCVPNVFIDDLMPDANGEYVKIYLYLLRCMNSAEGFSMSKIADRLDHTEKDIRRALKYWEKKQVLKLEYDDNDQLVGICFLDSSLAMPGSAPAVSTVLTAPVVTAVPEVPAVPAEADAAQKIPARHPSYTQDDLQQFQQHEAHRDLLYIIERYIGHPLSYNDIESIMYWHQTLDLSADLIEYLVESCVDNGHKSIRYMEKVALNWHASSIRTVSEAKQATGAYSRTYFGVMKAFGISNRNLIDYERALIDKWTNNYHFSLDIISEACKRTIQATNQPSFQYADSILENWYKNQVHQAEDIAMLDQIYRKNKVPAGRTAVSAKAVSGNRFNNFPQRSYNYDQLEKQLLNSSIQ
ncbi:MAG: DnaD domain protein [Lachnospiraceae bacterium]|nr:DnaD domain protein [Lachnospiraceae bacterium]